MELKSTALLIDGGHLRMKARAARLPENDPDFIYSVAVACLNLDKEEIHRVFYYDCEQIERELRRPISGEIFKLGNPDNEWLDQLAEKSYFAVRLGHLAFRGWQLKREYIRSEPTRPPTDYDFDMTLIQKGVDMRIGLDIAVLAETKAVDRVFIITADSDFIPAFKHGRKAGLQMGLIVLPGNPPRSLYQYFDIVREIEWP